MLTDDPLNPEAEAWLEIVNNTEDIEGNGYYYLLGIAAEASDNPNVFGRQQLADERGHRFVKKYRVNTKALPCKNSP